MMSGAFEVRVEALAINYHNENSSERLSRRRRWPYFVSSLSGIAVGVIVALVLTHISPLATHRVLVPLNSGVATPPVALDGVSDIARLLIGARRDRLWAVIGGSLLQAGLFNQSISAIERAIALDANDATLHVALGEAMALANNGQISDLAKAEFEIGLQADPNNLIARFYMAHWLLQNNKPKQALVKWVGLMRTVGADPVWYRRLWTVMPHAAKEVGISELALQALCTAGM
jgi:tetratricopeptide (TPR) repeat protein